MAPALVIFDFDGTIADSRTAMAKTSRKALESVGEASLPDELFLERVGLPLAQIFAEIAPHLDEAKREEVVLSYRAHYAEISRQHTRLYEGISALLEALRVRGATLAIATGKSTSGAHKSIDRLGIDKTLFARVVGTDGVPRPKPFPDMVTHICDDLAFARDDAVVVGDTTFDMQMSVDAGVRACGVTWGAHTRERLEEAGATWVVDTRRELSSILAVESALD